MPQPAQSLSANQVNAAISLLADELAIPAATIAWISGGVAELCDRSSASGIQLNAIEICAGLLRDLNEFYHGNIEEGLRQMQLSSSQDIGRVVWGLASKGIIQAEAVDGPADFQELIFAYHLNPFLASQHIRRKTLSITWCIQHLRRIFYVLGTAIVFAFYAQLVSPRLARIGWTIGMTGFAMCFLPHPGKKRF